VALYVCALICMWPYMCVPLYVCGLIGKDGTATKHPGGYMWPYMCVPLYVCGLIGKDGTAAKHPGGSNVRGCSLAGSAAACGGT
jgi:hypothetical protein